MVFSNNLITGLNLDPVIKDKILIAGLNIFKGKGKDYKIFNNIVRGSFGIGLLYPGYDCLNAT